MALLPKEYVHAFDFGLKRCTSILLTITEVRHTKRQLITFGLTFEEDMLYSIRHSAGIHDAAFND